jgi:hypothetical protein
MHCDYCPDEATARIPSNPGEVCRTHAIEYWTGLMAYARAQRTATAGCAPAPAAAGYAVRPAAGISRRSLHAAARVLTAH